MAMAEGLREFSRKIVNVDAFISEIREWIEERLQVLPSGKINFHPPFQVDQLRTLDYALVGVSFQQLLRMPVSQSYRSSTGKSFGHWIRFFTLVKAYQYSRYCRLMVLRGLIFGASTRRACRVSCCGRFYACSNTTAVGDLLECP